jgi:hypothetical protein
MMGKGTRRCRKKRVGKHREKGRWEGETKYKVYVKVAPPPFSTRTRAHPECPAQVTFDVAALKYP